MIKILFLSLFLPLTGFSQHSVVFENDYSFLANDNEIATLSQLNDTICRFYGQMDRLIFKRRKEIFKIKSIKSYDGITLIKVAHIVPVSLNVTDMPVSVWAIKRLDSAQIGFLDLAKASSTVEENFNIDLEKLKHSFFYTFFSDNYLKEVFSLKRITTKDQALAISNLIKTEKYKLLIETYKRTGLYDMYGSILMAELTNKACIELGFSPLKADSTISKLLN